MTSLSAAWNRTWDVVARSCLYLDRNEYDSYLALFEESSVYAITNYSPDLQKDIVHLKLNKEELANLFANIHNHVRLPGSLFRHASLYVIDQGEELYEAITYVTVTHTDLHGMSSIFCVGRYHDQIATSSGTPRIRSREFRMETRDIGAGCHYPI